MRRGLSDSGRSALSCGRRNFYEHVGGMQRGNRSEVIGSRAFGNASAKQRKFDGIERVQLFYEIYESQRLEKHQFAIAVVIGKRAKWLRSQRHTRVESVRPLGIE